MLWEYVIRRINKRFPLILPQKQKIIVTEDSIIYINTTREFFLNKYWITKEQGAFLHCLAYCQLGFWGSAGKYAEKVITPSITHKKN